MHAHDGTCLPKLVLYRLGLQHNMILYLKKNDYRCHDERLRYYDFPEMRNMKY